MPRDGRRTYALVFLMVTLLLSMSFIAPVRAGSVSDPQILDAHEQEVNNPGGSDIEVEEIVPMDEIIARCGDGDGCRLRLFHGAGGGVAVRLAAQVFSVQSNGEIWTIHAVDGIVLGAVTSDGDSSDGFRESIIFFNTGAEICEFYESGTTNDYRLRSQSTSVNPAFNCRLRIDD